MKENYSYNEETVDEMNRLARMGEEIEKDFPKDIKDRTVKLIREEKTDCGTMGTFLNAKEETIEGWVNEGKKAKK